MRKESLTSQMDTKRLVAAAPAVAAGLSWWALSHATSNFALGSNGLRGRPSTSPIFSGSSQMQLTRSEAPSLLGSKLLVVTAAASAAAVAVGRRQRAHAPGTCHRSGSTACRSAPAMTQTRPDVAGQEECIGANPATSWPAGKPAYTVEYPEVYDLSDPKGSFERVGQRLLQEMRDELPGLYELPTKEVNWVEGSLEYNTQGGKMNRGLIVVETGVQMMRHQGREPSNADLNRFAVLGWAVEYLQACMLMADDMMDGSLTRRGQPCWYRLENVGMLNTNDFLMVEMFVYKLLKRHFGQDKVFTWLLDLFLETTFQTECGQLLDSICANCTLEELTTERWTLIVKYKTAFYSFYLPVALSMLVTGVRDKAAYDVAREALLLMGVYFQAQDDYLDAFACPEELGKVGTDIQDKKCSWLFAHAYHEHGTSEARAYLDEHYGKCEVGSAEELRIKEIYTELGLKELFSKYEEGVQVQLKSYKQKVQDAGLPWSVFEMFFGMIHKRRK